MVLIKNFYTNFKALKLSTNLANFCLFKVSNRNTMKSCEICSKLIIKPSKWRRERRFGVFIVIFELNSHLFLVRLLLTLNKLDIYWVVQKLSIMLNVLKFKNNIGTYSELSQTSKMELVAKLINDLTPDTVIRTTPEI